MPVFWAACGCPDRSKWGQDHEDLVAVVVWAEAERSGPSADPLPAESSVEVLESDAGPGGEVELFQSRVVAGDLACAVHQGCSDTAATEVGVGLDVVDGAPVGNHGMGVTADAHPASEHPVDRGEDKPAALRGEAGDELLGDRRDMGDIDGRKGESDGSARVTDRDPAGDEFPGQLGADLVGAADLLKVRGIVAGHRPKLSRGVGHVYCCPSRWGIRRLTSAA